MSYQTIIDEIRKRLKWKEDMGGQWNPLMESQFQRWEQNICKQIDQESWAASNEESDGGVCVFLGLGSETIGNFVRENLVGRRKRVVKHSR